MAATDRETIYCRDHRLGHVADQPVEIGDLEQAVRCGPIVTGLSSLFDIAPDAEGTLARTGEDNRAHSVIRPRPLESVNQLLDGLGSEGVEPARAIDGDDSHRTLDLVKHVLVVSFGVYILQLQIGHRQLARSSSVPVPRPPPQHIVTSP